MTFSGLDLLGADAMIVGFTPGAMRAATLPTEDAADRQREAADLRAGQDLARRLQSGAYDAEVAARTGTPASAPPAVSATPGIGPPQQSPGPPNAVADWLGHCGGRWCGDLCIASGCL